MPQNWRSSLLFFIKNNLKYYDAERITRKIKNYAIVEKNKNIPDRDILYTRTIINEINKIDDEDNLIAYITENIENFGYNNATVIEFIKNLWSSISGKDGLAKNEGEYIAVQRNVMPIDLDTKEDKFLDDNYVVSDKEASSWTIYNQILGLDYAQEKKFSTKRSLASAFSENMLLPLKSSLSFPSSQMINSILRGELGDNESYRKMLILLVFYSFWAKKTIDCKSVDVKASVQDSERCLYSINKFLVDSGYPTLYFGNPYDWIFMWALNAENPLEAFRSYILG